MTLYYTGQYAEQLRLAGTLGGDVAMLEERVRRHVGGARCMASLRSRCVRGNTLFHLAVKLNSTTAVEVGI